MLGLLLIYWIGKWYYNLAKEYNKNKIVFAILGVVTYYGFTVLAAAAIIILADAEWVYNTPDQLLGLMGVPFGLAAMWGLYTVLKNSWKKEIVNDVQLLDDNEF